MDHPYESNENAGINCIRCGSGNVVVTSLETNLGAIGMQTGSIIGGALLIACGPLAMVAGLLAGAVAGCAVGTKTGKALEPRSKYKCRNCGCSWKE
jgi:hypothetical protein